MRITLDFWRSGRSNRAAGPSSSSLILLGLAAALLVACGSDGGSNAGPTASNEEPKSPAATGGAPAASGAGGAAGDSAGGAGDGSQLFATSSVVLSADAEDNTYVSLLKSLGNQTIDFGSAREFSGWASIWSTDSKLFVSDGDGPTIARYAVDDARNFSAEGALSFLNYGASFADSLFVAPGAAYVFADDGVVWDPQAMAIVGSFALPQIPDRDGGMRHSGLRTDRSAVVRGNRAYLATNWANWEEYTVSEDSLIVVIDTDKNQIIGSLPVACPYLDVATLADDGTIYFSNWVYSLGPTLLHGKAKACAVRILPGEDTIDSWSLTFADVTGGREAAALRSLGNGKALISVFHDEQADTTVDDASLANAANWRFWELDLEARKAHPIADIEAFAGGFSMSQIDGRSFVLVPRSDYESTAVYEILANGTAVQRWESPGWSTQLLKLR